MLIRPVNDWPLPIAAHLHGKQVWKCPIYTMWANMLQRCGMKPGKVPPTYSSVRVCSEWLSFSAFRAWVVINRFEECMELDKDLLYPGSEYYSPETCLILRREVNRTLHIKRDTGLYPAGVTAKGERFVARICIPGSKRKHLGTFNTARDAHIAWQEGKMAVISDLISTEPNQKVGAALQRVVDNIAEDVQNGKETTKFKGDSFC